MNKVVIIGVDGATPELIEKWTEKDLLPNFSKIKKNGVYGRLKSTIPPWSAPSWASIITGCNPGKHSIYCFESTEDIETHLISSKNRKVPAIWNYLTDLNMSNIVVNVPGSYPPEKINGVMITGLLVPSPKSNFTYPNDIKKRLTKDDLGEYELESIWLEDLPRSYLAKHNPEKLLSILNKQIESRVNVTVNLMKKMKWDFTMVVLRAADTAQHFMFHDKKIILKMYQKTDELVGKIIDTEPNATFFIVSDHGFQQIKKILHTDNVLYSNGYLKPIKDPKENYMFMLNQMINNLLISILRLLPPERLKHSSFIKKILFSATSKDKVYDLSQTKAFSISEGRGVQINLKCQYKQGIVEIKEYEKIRNELINLFENLKDPETGEKFINKVYKSNELYGEKAINPLDLVLELAPHYTSFENLRLSNNFLDNLRLLVHKKTIPYLFNGDIYAWSGDHSQYGIFFAFGNNIKKDYIVEKISVFDIAPNVFASLQLEPLKIFDGRICEKIFLQKPTLKKINIVNIDKIRKIIDKQFKV